MYLSIKQHVKTNYPTFFGIIRDIKDQIKIEYRTIRQIGLSRILQSFTKARDKWKNELPLQSMQEVCLNESGLADLCAISTYQEGGHCYYFAPENMPTSLKMLLDLYPNGCGIKINKRIGGIDKPFPNDKIIAKTHEIFAPKHKELLLVHNLFYVKGFGPRVYDLLNLKFNNGDIHAAYVMEHIVGRTPVFDECKTFVDCIKKLEEDKLIKLINWNGYADIDFTPPDCNGNLIFDEKSTSLKYIDLQNFSLNNYHSFLESNSKEATDATHFGQKSYLMGGKYLYQEIPGLNFIAKRSPAKRFSILLELMHKANVTLNHRLVIDVGCNLGLMGAQYLKNGAYWLHGFDLPEVVKNSEKILLSVGCNRFSLSGVNLSKDFILTDHLPTFLKPKLSGCIISYLAIRGHIGWVRELGQINWEYLVYEGHEEENKEKSLEFINELQKIKACDIVSDGFISDANSHNRYIAIIKAR